MDRCGGELRLGSWTRSRVWPTGERLEARCGPAWLGREAPAHGHRCGIYALRTCELAERLLSGLRLPSPRPVVIGRVSLWGRVFENTDGWRAQYAYPYELLVVGGDRQTVRGLRSAYAVDVARYGPDTPH